MKKEESLLEKERLDRVEKRLESAVSTYETAALFDYKLSEFIRLGTFNLFKNPPQVSPVIPHAMSSVFSAVITYLNFLSEMDKIKNKIQAVLNTLQPPMPGPGLPIPPPVPPTPGTRKMRQVLEVITAAKDMAGNAEPKLAKDSLKEAKELLKDESVKNEFRQIRQVNSWYDILEELQAVMDYLENICK